MATSEQSSRDAPWRMTNAYQASQAIHVAASLGIADHFLRRRPIAIRQPAPR